MKKILFYSANAPIGGHLRSSLTIANELYRRNYNVHFIAGPGLGESLFANYGFTKYILPYSTGSTSDFNWKNYKFLEQYIAKFRPHVVHSFLKGIPQLTILKNKYHYKFIATICGGKPPNFFPKTYPLTVFSEELKTWLLKNKFMEDGIFVIPGRMDITSTSKYVDLSFFDKLKIDKNKEIVMMVCRAEKRKEYTIQSFFKAAELVGIFEKNIIFIHIGQGNDASYYSEIQSQVTDVNRRVGFRILISTTYSSDNPLKCLPLARYVVGMGRSAFEAMSLKKITFILCNQGYGGLVSSKNIKKISAYNFTSRFLDKWESDVNLTGAQLAKDIRFILQNKQKHKEFSNFSYSYYQKHLDVKNAVDSYEKIYCSNDILHKPLDPISIIHLIAREALRKLYYNTFLANIQS